jgi:hypothetical protein
MFIFKLFTLFILFILLNGYYISCNFGKCIADIEYENLKSLILNEYKLSFCLDYQFDKYNNNKNLYCYSPNSLFNIIYIKRCNDLNYINQLDFNNSSITRKISNIYNLCTNNSIPIYTEKIFEIDSLYKKSPKVVMSFDLDEITENLIQYHIQEYARNNNALSIIDYNVFFLTKKRCRQLFFLNKCSYRNITEKIIIFNLLQII